MNSNDIYPGDLVRVLPYAIFVKNDATSLHTIFYCTDTFLCIGRYTVIKNDFAYTEIKLLSTRCAGNFSKAVGLIETFAGYFEKVEIW